MAVMAIVSLFKFIGMFSQSRETPTLQPIAQSEPVRLTPHELDALFEKVIRFTHADLPHLNECASIARSILHAWPTTKEIAEWTEGSLIRCFARIVHDFPVRHAASPFTHTFQPEYDWGPDAYANNFRGVITAAPDGNKITAGGIGQLNHPLFVAMEAEMTRLFNLPIPIPYTEKKRFEHTQIVGGSGAGKTTLLSHLILHDLHKPSPPGIILIDPKNLVIPKLSKLALFDGPLKDRLIVFSPEYKPSINLFDNTGRGTVGAVDTLKYLCSALSAEFTTLQEGLAANLARLLLVFPQTLGRNATLNDLRALMVDKFPEGDYRKAVSGLRPVQQEFYQAGGFDNSEYREAKRQIRRRLDQMIGSEHLESLFHSQRNAINIAEEMQKGSIILVDCAERLMDERAQASAFGCVFLAEVFRAIMQRNALPDDQKRPCFLFVDEAATFFRGDMNYFFEGARQCHVGGTFAFHYLNQKGAAELKETMMNMTSTKLVSGRAKEDANAFAIHMGYRGSPSEFGQLLDNLPPYHFALSIAGVQEKAVGINAPEDPLGNEPPMSDAAYARFIEANRRRVGGQQQRPGAPPPPPSPPGAKPAMPPPNKPKEPPHKWTEQDEQALADAEDHCALARRRKQTKRVAELEEIMAAAKARKKASEDYYGA